VEFGTSFTAFKKLKLNVLHLIVKMKPNETNTNTNKAIESKKEMKAIPELKSDHAASKFINWR